MKLRTMRKRQRGAALLLTVFALVLLTGLGLAMLYSSDTETSISVNYRDKQVAFYAALSGLQEARDRIHPLTGDLGPKSDGTGLNIVPTTLPSLGAKNVLYIINPGPGETVAPWDPSNEYFDTELCQENVLGLSGTPGVPCDPTKSTSIPSGNSWYAYFDNSQNKAWDGRTGTGAWQLKDAGGNLVPIPYKWVRITLKADNMTPVTVGTGTGKQVCWDGTHQSQLPSNYHQDCTPPKDGVTNITITNPGEGYTGTPPLDVQITGGGGSGAQAQGTIGQIPSGVTSVTLTDGGSGYTTAPLVQVVPVDGNGSGAVVKAILNASLPLQSVTLNNSGTPPCYQGTPSINVTFSPAGSPDATTTIQWGKKCVASIPTTALTGECNVGSSAATASGGAPGTSGSAFAATIGYKERGNSGKYDPISVTVTNPGDYDSLPTSFSTGCNGVTIDKSKVIFGYQITGVTVQSGQRGAYSSAPQVSFSGGTPVNGSGSLSGTGVLDGTMNPTNIAVLDRRAGGVGYTANPNLIIAPPDTAGTTATGTATISPTSGVVSIKVTNPGSGYTSRPTVTLVDGGGTGARAVATIGAGGTYSGRVYLLTAMAETPSGAKAMAQMEVGVTYEDFSFNLGGALTLAGPSPAFGTPNSQGFVVNGRDCHATNSCNTPPSPGCNTTPFPAKPAIGVYDDPNNPTTPTAVATVLNSLGKPDNYIGAKAAPDIENAYGTLGTLSPSALNAFAESWKDIATVVYGSNPPSIELGSAINPTINYIDGDLTLGPVTGYGVLVVRGTLTIGGDYDWNGLILVIGEGAAVFNGSGNGQVNGAVFVANTAGGTLNSPMTDYSGGGGNGVQYDHCWADHMLSKAQFTPPVSPEALKVISLRMLEY
ncbi:MAG TPA: hypothetical protein VD837_14540 [Terriglobales bacterium]|nr:hypothetical protein [Terriglobales bacterium]